MFMFNLKLKIIMKEKNFTFTENQVELLCESIIAKMWSTTRVIEMISNHDAKKALERERQELRSLLDFLTEKED